MNGTCPQHGVAWKTVPAGISKKTGRPYGAFQVCPIEGCTEKPAKLDRSEPIDNAILEGIQAPQTAQNTIDRRSYRIERQHSQDMAIEFLKVLVLTKQLDEVTTELVTRYTEHFMEDLDEPDE